MKLNLGACDRLFPGFLSVDICPPADIVCDLRERWPWDDSSVEAVKAFDIFEHLPDKIHTMNELYRVMGPNGTVEIEVPSASHGAGAFQDPTHCSFWTMNDFQYFQFNSFATQRFARAYGISAKFAIIEMKETQYQDMYEPVWKIHATLRAMK